MIKDYIIIDDVLDNPDELVQLSKIISFYSKEKENLEGITTKPMLLNSIFSNSHWRGFRSDFLHEINQQIFEKTFKQIMEKMLDCFDGQPKLYHYKVLSALHFAPASIEYTDDWWHTDQSCLFAGVLYLNETPESDSGTILRLNDSEMVVENTFNRLVLYRSNIEHRPQKCFGDSVENCRLVMPMFFHEICLKA